ncbi:DUF1963 domain-containing protein [bacterium]|nr:DUF1963 domain-containing protein [bacterium]
MGDIFDAISQLLKEIDEFGKSFPKVDIYALKKSKKSKGDYNIIYGDGSELSIDWPKTTYDREMDFLFMLDFNSFPNLKEDYPNYAALGFFIENDEEWDLGGSEDDFESEDYYDDEFGGMGFTQQETKIVFFTEDELKLSKIRGKNFFEVITFSVPYIIFGDPEDEYFSSDKVFKDIDEPLKSKLKELQNKVYNLGARVYGDPIWLQSNEGGANGFIMQFDGNFADINLGDSGIMYVYNDYAFWQCY